MEEKNAKKQKSLSSILGAGVVALACFAGTGYNLMQYSAYMQEARQYTKKTDEAKFKECISDANTDLLFAMGFGFTGIASLGYALSSGRKIHSSYQIKHSKHKIVVPPMFVKKKKDSIEIRI